MAGQGVCQVRCSAAANPAHKNSKRQYAWCWDNKKLRQSTDEGPPAGFQWDFFFCFGLALMHLSRVHLSIFKTEGRCSDRKQALLLHCFPASTLPMPPLPPFPVPAFFLTLLKPTIPLSTSQLLSYWTHCPLGGVAGFSKCLNALWRLGGGSASLMGQQRYPNVDEHPSPGCWGWLRIAEMNLSMDRQPSRCAVHHPFHGGAGAAVPCGPVRRHRRAGQGWP